MVAEDSDSQIRQNTDNLDLLADNFNKMSIKQELDDNGNVITTNDGLIEPKLSEKNSAVFEEKQLGLIHKAKDSSSVPTVITTNNDDSSVLTDLDSIHLTSNNIISLDLNTKTDKLTVMLEDNAGNFREWYLKLCLLVAFGGIKVPSFENLFKKDNLVELSTKSNAHLSMIIVNSISSNSSFYEDVRELIFKDEINTAVSMVKILQTFHKSHLVSDIDKTIDAFTALEFKETMKLHDYNKKYMDYVIHLTTTTDFVIGTVEKLRYFRSLGTYPYVMRARFDVTQAGIESKTLT